MPSSDFHLDRVRAESFGADPDTYDRVRPGPPPDLIDDLVALNPRRVLDVATGTGKIARALAARGLNVLGVEADRRMAALAPAPVEVAPFEDWDEAGRTFDLVTCADAWHWLEPERAEAKVTRVARGGMFVRLWMFHTLEPELLAAVDAVHARLAPHIRAPGHPFSGWDVEGEERVYRWNATLTREDWLALVGTYSGHATLPNRAALDAELRAVLPEQVRARFGFVSRWRAVPR